jgi:hypothetical protein
MSTISTHLNWGSSYIVNDFNRRFLKPEASEKELVMVGRISTVILMIFAGLLALSLQNALQAFNILLQIGAGTGLLFILRWFWWRVNAWSEITAMVVSFLMALYLEIIHVNIGFEAIDSHWKLLIGVGVTSLSWIIVAYSTPPADMKVMMDFVKRINPGGPGWAKVERELGLSEEEIKSKEKKWDVPRGILAMLTGVILVYSALFATGFWIYENTIPAIILSVVVLISGYILARMVKKISFQ